MLWFPPYLFLSYAFSLNALRSTHLSIHEDEGLVSWIDAFVGLEGFRIAEKLVDAAENRRRGSWEELGRLVIAICHQNLQSRRRRKTELLLGVVLQDDRGWWKVTEGEKLRMMDDDKQRMMDDDAQAKMDDDKQDGDRQWEIVS